MGSITDPAHVPRRDFPPRRATPGGLLSALPFGASATVYTRHYQPRAAAEVTFNVNADQDGTTQLQRRDDLGTWHNVGGTCPVMSGVNKALVVNTPGLFWRVCYTNTSGAGGLVRVEVVERQQ